MKKSSGKKRRRINAAAAILLALVFACMVFLVALSSVSASSARYSVSESYSGTAIFGKHQIGGHDGDDWTDINSLKSSNDVYTISATGNYYLSADLEGDLYINTSDIAVNLCLNGCKLTGKGSSGTYGSVIYVDKANVQLNLYDCGGEMKPHYYKQTECDIKGPSGETLCYYDFSSATEGDCDGYIVGGVICGGRASSSNRGGGLTFSGNNDAFNMHGGTIAGNVSEYHGGGVAMISGTGQKFDMYGGVISGNCSCSYGDDSTTNNRYDGGGGVDFQHGTFTMHDGTISDNYSSYGGGVSVFSLSSTTSNNTYFSMEGGTISGNHARYGGGVYVYGGENSEASAYTGVVQFEMSGGSIEGNVGDGMGTSSSPRGGGVYVNGSGVSFKMTGGKITGNIETVNTGSYRGGGIFIFSCKSKGFELGGEAYIYGNYLHTEDDNGDATSQTACNIGMYYSTSSPRHVYLSSALSGGALVGFYCQSDADSALKSGSKLQFSDTDSSSVMNDSLSHIVSDRSEYGIDVGGSGNSYYLEFYLK